MPTLPTYTTALSRRELLLVSIPTTSKSLCGYAFTFLPGYKSWQYTSNSTAATTTVKHEYIRATRHIHRLERYSSSHSTYSTKFLCHATTTAHPTREGTRSRQNESTDKQRSRRSTWSVSISIQSMSTCEYDQRRSSIKSGSFSSARIRRRSFLSTPSTTSVP